MGLRLNPPSHSIARSALNTKLLNPTPFIGGMFNDSNVVEGNVTSDDVTELAHVWLPNQMLTLVVVMTTDGTLLEPDKHARTHEYLRREYQVLNCLKSLMVVFKMMKAFVSTRCID